MPGNHDYMTYYEAPIICRQYSAISIHTWFAEDYICLKSYCKGKYTTIKARER